MLVSVRRVAALVAVPALALGAVTATSTPASAASDPSAVSVSADWLAAQAPDYGALAIGNTIDQAIALEAVGGHDAAVQSIGAGVADHLSSYTHYSYCDDFTAPYETPPCETTPLIEGVSAGAVAKSLVGLQVAGIDATDVDGTNLVTQLEDLLPDSGALTGRAVSPQTSDGSPTYSGYTNVIGQTFAVRGLQTAGSDEAAAAAAYLIGLQCADGSFKEDLPDEAGPQTCAGTPSYSATSVDSTALAVLALDQVDSPAADAAATKAAGWLASVQQISGGFANDGTSAGPNANSTGLATQALAVAGAAQDAATGAAWIRGQQLVDLGSCRPVAAADRGAVAYDAADLATGLTSANRATWLRATTQALPALQWAPAGTGTKVSGPTGFRRAGTTQTVTVTGAAPGQALCASAGSQRIVTNADLGGRATFAVKLGARTGRTAVTVSKAGGSAGAATITGLAAKRLPVTARSTVRRGQVLRVVVRGLAAGEPVRVAFRGRAKAGKANANGAFVASLRATGKPGKARVTVRGQFTNRTGTKTVKVVR